MAEVISIFGQVRGFNEKPIHMIRVTVYRDYEVTHEYTNEEGRYSISLPPDSPITVRFDTHYSLTNARKWHPSVVANVEAKQDVTLNRFLLEVGQYGPDMVVVDRAAYQFAAVWNAGDFEPPICGTRRTSGNMKVPSVLDMFTPTSRSFAEQARTPENQLRNHEAPT
jgi:hypothetical protein